MEAPDLNPTRRAILDRLKRKGPQTAADLADHLGITPMGVRQHLGILQGQGLVGFEDRKGAVGRPSRHWQLREAAEALYPNRHGELVASLLKSLTEVEGPAGMQRLLDQRNRGLELSYRKRIGGPERPLRERVAELAAVRSAEGYMAEWWEGKDGDFFLAENHCPICEAARACVGLCAAENTLFQKVLGPAVAVRRTEHILEGSRRCVYRIAPA